MLHTLENPVRRCSPSEDVVPFSECRNNFSAYIERARETHRTTLVTQNGHAAVYIVNATDFDNLMDKIDLWRDVETSRREIAEGKAIPHEKVMRGIDELLQNIANRKSHE